MPVAPPDHEDPAVTTVILEAVGRIPTTTILAISLALVALVGIGDFITGADISFTAFYLLPVVLAASSAGHRSGFGIAAVTAVLWFTADLGGRRQPYDTVLVPIWNACVRFLVFVLVIGLLDALKTSVAHERNLSRQDTLSGLPNSRAFYELAEQERRRLARTGAPLTVAYLDIDDFKVVNDTLGHAAGDGVLRATSVTLRKTLREVDLVSRLGGDEFAVLLPDTDEAAAAEVLTRLQDALRVEALANGWPIGFSIGSVTYATAPASVDQLLGRPDALMYEVKRAGKNGIRTAGAA